MTLSWWRRSGDPPGRVVACASARVGEPAFIPDLRRLVYRVDGGPELGLGHLARATAVAEVLTRAGRWRVEWAGDGGPSVEAAARDAGACVVSRAPGEPEAVLLDRAARGASVVVLDRKLPYTSAEIAELNRRCPVVCLDVVCEGMYEAAAAVFPVVDLDPVISTEQRWRGSGRLHHGAEWVIVHPRVRAVGVSPVEPSEEALVGVAAGGSDPADVATRALDWLDEVDVRLRIEVMVGAANSRRQAVADRARRARHPITVCGNPEEFPARIARATLAIATFGVTAYELAYLGVPAVLVSHSEENARTAARFARHGCALDLGLATDIEARTASRRLTELLTDCGAREAMARAGTRLVDGRGAERLVGLLGQLIRERAGPDPVLDAG